MSSEAGTLLLASHLTKSFSGLKAVSDVSLTVRQGEIVGIIGPNGAGKTTLFNLISGFLRPDGGTVTFDGQNIVGLKPHRICQLGLTRTFQIVKPFGHLTALENVSVGAFARCSDISTVERRAWDLLEFVGLERKALFAASSLTTPDRKRLELARALATQPKLILLDEVMAGLNPAEKEDVIALVRKVRDSGVAVLLIEHAMRVIMGLSDRLVVLHHGECIFSGSPQEACSDPGVIEAYLGRHGVAWR
jgi:branched-chain amino acid transport system ATP-binding protein